MKDNNFRQSIKNITLFATKKINIIITFLVFIVLIFINVVLKSRIIASDFVSVFLQATIFCCGFFLVIECLLRLLLFIKHEIYEGGFIYNIINTYKQRKKYETVQATYPEKIARIRKYYKEHRQLRVAFLVIYSNTFQTASIFEKMLEDDVFDPYIIVIPDMGRAQSHRNTSFIKSFNDLRKIYGDRVIEGCDLENDSYLEIGEEYQLVFFNNPYANMAHQYHHVLYFLDKLVLPMYVYYGLDPFKFGRSLMKTDCYLYCWKLFVDSKINLKNLKKYHPLKGKNAVVTGYLKMDRLADMPIHKKERKLVIIAPHHTVMGWKALDISNFLVYQDLFLEIPALYPDIDFVFRPHPLLFYNLINNGIWAQQELDAYLARIEELPNIRYDDSADYFELFANSDGIIHDCGSYIGEYLFTEKPSCYMLKSPKQVKAVMNTMGQACMKHYYKAYNREDICAFIDDVIIEGKDPMKIGRETFSRKMLKFNYPNGAETAIKVIKDAIVN